MIVVKIELHSAITGKISEIGRMYIYNIGGTKQVGDYSAKVMRRGVTDPRGRATRISRVEAYPRLKLNVWRLVMRALKGAFPEEK